MVCFSLEQPLLHSTNCAFMSCGSAAYCQGEKYENWIYRQAIFIDSLRWYLLPYSLSIYYPGSLWISLCCYSVSGCVGWTTMTLSIQNRRKQQRHQFTDTVTICPNGVSQVIDISSGGISFRCRCEHCLSKRWKIDIVDTTGIHLQEFPVEKIWESVEDQKRYGSIYTVTVGVKFNGLSPKQYSALYQLIFR